MFKIKCVWHQGSYKRRKQRIYVSEEAFNRWWDYYMKEIYKGDAIQGFKLDALGGWQQIREYIK